MSVVEILRQARELIADKSRWTQQFYARNKRGIDVSATDDEAVCFCAVGALIRIAAGDHDGLNRASFYLRNESYRLFDAEVPYINDSRVDLLGNNPHQAILLAYDAAISAAEAANA